MEYGRLARQEAVRGGEHVGHEIRALHLQTSQRPSTLTPAPRRSRHFGTGAAGVTNGGSHRGAAPGGCSATFGGHGRVRTRQFEDCHAGRRPKYARPFGVTFG